MLFHPGESKEKNVATDNGNPPGSREGAAREPSGSTLLGSMGSKKWLFKAKMLGVMFKSMLLARAASTFS